MYFLLFSRRENIPKEGGGWGSNADLTSYLLLRCMPVLFFLNDEAGALRIDGDNLAALTGQTDIHILNSQEQTIATWIFGKQEG